MPEVWITRPGRTMSRSTQNERPGAPARTWTRRTRAAETNTFICRRECTRRRRRVVVAGAPEVAITSRCRFGARCSLGPAELLIGAPGSASRHSRWRTIGVRESTSRPNQRSSDQRERRDRRAHTLATPQAARSTHPHHASELGRSSRNAVGPCAQPERDGAEPVGHRA